MQCPAFASLDRRMQARPEYPPAENPRLCFRGHYISELLSHPARLNRARMRHDGRQSQMTVEQAVEHAMRRMQAVASPAQVGLLMDGNCGAQAIEAAMAFARDVLGTPYRSVYLPPSDGEILRAMEGVVAAQSAPARFRECDVIVAVGDPFATHPVVAGPILDALRRDKPARFVVVDVAPGLTARFATEFVQIEWNQEWKALAAVLFALNLPVPEQARRAGAERSALEALPVQSAAAAIGAAKNLGIVLSLPTGRSAHTELAARLALALHQARGGVLVPLFTYGAAESSHSAALQQGAVPLGALLNALRTGPLKALMMFGVDLLAAMPFPWLCESLARLPFLVVAAPLANDTTALADVVLPLPFWFEEHSTLLHRSRQAEAIPPLAPPPLGVPTHNALFAILTEACRRVGYTSAGTAEMLARNPTPDAGGSASQEPGTFVLATRPEHFHFADGALTRHIRWAQAMQQLDRVEINAEQASKLGLREGDAVNLSAGENRQAILTAHRLHELPPGAVLAAESCLNARTLLNWSIDPATEEVKAEPSRVLLTSLRSAPAEPYAQTESKR